MKQIIIIFILSSILSGCNNGIQKTSITPEDLRCEYLVNPIGIDQQNPALSWVIPNHVRGIKQSAYQILVASNPDLLADDQGDIWDSGKISSNSNINVHFNGSPLMSFTPYYWKVRIWDQYDNPSAYSEPAVFETSMLSQSDWKAQWISDGSKTPDKPEDFYKKIPNALFRKPFNAGKTIADARLYITGLGYFEAYINGTKVGNDVLHPGWTQYAKRILYSTYDITDMLQEGSNNVIGIMLGNGWYNPLPLGLFRKYNLRKYLTIGQPKCIAEVHIIYEDGSDEWILTDESWKTGQGPILKNNVYLGEYYDAREEQPGWNITAFDDSHWQQAVQTESPGGDLRVQLTPPNKITKELKAVSLTEPDPGVYVYDFGQNFAGWIDLKLKGKAGEKIKIRYGELLYDSGRVNGMTTVAGHIKERWNLSGGPGAPKTAYQEDTYVLKGGEEETFRQHFTFHAFRYIEITGYSGTPELEDATGLRINADLEKTGYFSSSDSLLNKIQNITEWTFLSNVFSIQSDCPGREKFGYGGDIVTACEAYIYNFDMSNFYKKTVRDFAYDARPNGTVPETAPFNGIDTKGFPEGGGPIGWQLAHPYTLKRLYEYYGDSAFVADQYPVVVKMVDYLKTQAQNNLIYHGIGDHVAVDPKPDSLTSGAFYYNIVKLCADFADILGKEEACKQYRALQEKIKNSFIDTYLQRGTGALTKNPTQITQVFGLFYDLLPEDEQSKAFDLLVDQIMNKHNGHLSTGIFGTKMLWDVLRAHERNDIAYTINTQTEYPSYGYMLENNATTLWEHWDKSNNQNSKNHPMFGSVSEWFFEGLAGINIDHASTKTFNPFVIKPQPVKGLEHVNGKYKSVRGDVVSNWKRLDDGGLEMAVEIPGNTEATIYIPVIHSSNEITVTESDNVIYSKGKPKNADGLSFGSATERWLIWKAGAGKYSFVVR